MKEGSNVNCDNEEELAMERVRGDCLRKNIHVYQNNNGGKKWSEEHTHRLDCGEVAPLTRGRDTKAEIPNY